MSIDRENAKRVFAEYTDRYDSRDPKIFLKIEHTYCVAALCEEIGQAAGLKGEELDLAWLCGLLHDIGRFEQVRRYKTFIDADSIDHAKLSSTLLFGEAALIRAFVSDSKWDELINQAVMWHSIYRLPEGMDEETVRYCNILRDADKLDIFRVLMTTPLEDIFNVTTEEIKTSQISPEVMQVFNERHAAMRSIRKTAIDQLAGHICLVYELVYPESRRIAVKQGYFEQMLNFKSENSVTEKQFCVIREKIHSFLKNS